MAVQQVLHRAEARRNMPGDARHQFQENTPGVRPASIS
jgi:hypothetical protein